jgi:hypothetical protein
MVDLLPFHFMVEQQFVPIAESSQLVMVEFMLTELADWAP